MSSDEANDNTADRDQNDGDSSGEDEAQQRMLSLRERKRKYYEERKKVKSQPASMRDLLENGNANEHATKEQEKRFINIRIYTRVNPNQYIGKDEGKDEIQLKGEVEIADYITYEELTVKAINLFNQQLKDKGLEIEFIKERAKYFSFRFAKRDGLPDSDFP